jgi:hypothetical protein
MLGAAPVPSFGSGVPFAVLGLTISSVVGFPPPCERYHRRDMADAMNRVARVELVLNQAGDWDVAVTNEIAPVHGRGSQIHDIVAQMRADSAKALARGDEIVCYPLKPLPIEESNGEPEPEVGGGPPSSPP